MDKEPKFQLNEGLLEEYKNKLWILVNKFVSENRADEITNLLAKKGDELKGRYSNAESYMLWHVISGSSFDHSIIRETDFPGEDSVALFIDELANSETLG